MLPLEPERIAIHTMTTRPWSLAEACRAYTAAGVAGVSPWVEHVEPIGVEEAAKIITGSGLRVPAYVRAGFFVHPDAAERAGAVVRAKALIDDAATLGAEMLVIVPGSHPGVPLAVGRQMVTEALAGLADHARAAGVRLALEPLHPMYAADRSCVNTVASARTVCKGANAAEVGVVVDTYHVWWEPGLAEQIAALGREGRLLAFHIADFKADTTHLLLDRGLMGEGVVPLREIRAAAEAAGFAGLCEIEIFSERFWSGDQAEFLRRILAAARDSA